MNITTIDTEELLSKARALVCGVEADDEEQVVKLLDELAQVRESTLFLEIGKMTRQLHESLNSFRFDERIADLTEHDIPDAKERLNYVITMTQQAAHRTLSAVETTIPLSDVLQTQANALKLRWERLMRKEIDKQEFKTLSQEMGAFLPLVEENSNKIRESLSEVMLAQDYQDITGQIIQRVITLVQNMEENLVNLIKASGQKMVPGVRANGLARTGLEGPQINPGARADVVQGQDDVDVLLSSLGF